MRRGIVVSVVVFLGLCCLLAVAAGLGYYFLWPRAVARPVVLIRSPRYGEQVEVGEMVTIHSIARDEGKVARLELWVGDELQEAQSSTLPGGTSPFPLLARWQPPSAGTHTLIVRAINTQGAQGQASVNVEAVELGDRDGDGVPDEEDLCPDEPGPDVAHGCPDSDGDGVPDAEDACPDEPSLTQPDGCPVPTEEDSDGDGLLDWADECPDEPGPPLTEGCPDRDGDGVADAEDACPDEPGLPRHDGCPTPGDLDGDGVPDEEDDCPVDFGVPEHGGCPDNDGDGIRDIDDRCPFEPGLPELDGCPDRDGDGVADPDDLRPDEPGDTDHGAPDTGAGDRDGDGFPDDIDPCPDEWGTLEDGGCPPPGDPETDEGGPFPDMGDWGVVWTVEFQALEFEVFDDYDEVYCYAGLADEDMDRYGPFEIGDEARHWNISTELGSRFVAFEAESLRVQVDCWATAGILGRRYPVDLGSFTREHPRSDWDGQVITVESDPGPDGHYFEVQYRICEESCVEAAFPPPLLLLTEAVPPGGGEPWMRVLTWRWDGDESMITGFKLYVDEGLFLTFTNPSRRSWVVSEAYHPACGERVEFQMTAYSGHPVHPDRESPPSNIQVLEGEACPRIVRVQFQSLRSYWIRERRGPIKGTFMANDQPLLPIFRVVPPTFDATDNPRQYIEAASTVDIRELFDDIATEAEAYGGIHFTDNYAPRVDYIDVELGPDDDLTFCADIEDSSGRTVFDACDSLSPDEIPVPGGGGGRTIWNRDIELSVWVMGLHR